uniref:Uncharacterized protein n=1 Tax=Dunaliella tertiolecta TaxID=3047 RepID=A0A6S8J8B7_DUNTE
MPSIKSSRWVAQEEEEEQENKDRERKRREAEGKAGGKRSRWDAGGDEGDVNSEGGEGNAGGEKGDAPAMKSRWEKRDEEEAGGGRLVAKRRKEALNLSDADILSELNSTFASAGAGAAPNQRRRSSLRGGRQGAASAEKRRVWWPDEDGTGKGEEDAAGGIQGFTIQPVPKPLAEVYYVVGLGPLPGENAMVYMDEASPFITRDAQSFADQVSLHMHVVASVSVEKGG